MAAVPAAKQRVCMDKQDFKAEAKQQYMHCSRHRLEALPCAVTSQRRAVQSKVESCSGVQVEVDGEPCQEPGEEVVKGAEVTTVADGVNRTVVWRSAGSLRF